MTKKLIAILFTLAALPVGARAQDAPVVFVHGFGSDQHTWEATALRLQQQLAIRPYLAQLRWKEAFETQGNELQAEFGSLPASTIAVGHSNGGLASRQWSLQHTLAGLLTVGTPNSGAPIVDHLQDMGRFSQDLYNAVGLAGGALAIDPTTWNFIYLWVRGALLFGTQLSVNTIYGVAGLGLQLGLPVTGQMSTGSYLIAQLNSSSNIAREQATIARRAGLLYVASNYSHAGPARAFDPGNADAYFDAMWASIYTMELAASSLMAAYPTNSTATWIASSLFRVAGMLRWVDPTWCWLVTNDSSCAVPHDGIVPVNAQVLPAAPNILVGGPAHIQETKESGPIQYALSTYLNVVPRGGAPTPTYGASGSDELGPGQTLFAGQSRTSGDGRFELDFQGDGNLVLYRRSDGAALWATNTYAPGGEAAMQTDGNLVVYDAAGVARWYSNTSNYPGARLFVQSDGNVVIYDYYGFPIWATGTVQ